MSIAYVFCRLCTSNYQTTIHHLTEPIDVYCEWIDQSEKLQKTMDNKEKKLATEDIDDDDEEDDSDVSEGGNKIKNDYLEVGDQ